MSKDMKDCKCPANIDNRHLEACPCFKPPSDPVKSPDHYTWHPLIQCMKVIRYFPTCRGAAIKYIWRAGRKHGEPAEKDLQKAIEFLQEEIDMLSKSGTG